MLKIIQYKKRYGLNAQRVLSGLFLLVFKTHLSNAEFRQLTTRDNLIFLIAFQRCKPAGFKIGYTLPGASDTLYSWAGGTAPHHRRLGFAWELMMRQHQLATECGLSAVETKCRPKWAEMMHLNYKAGFTLLRKYTGKKWGKTKVLLRKGLTN